MSEPRFVPLSSYRSYPEPEMQHRARAFYEDMQRRRTVRQFSDRPVPRNIIEDCLRAAGTAPSGAHMQPWHFVVVEDPERKRRIREAAEKEEHEFYHRRATPEWLAALAPLGTDEHKPYLEIAPYLIAVFIRRHTLQPDGVVLKHYYAVESVGLATGLLIAAVHNAGLVSLTHTNEVLERPESERPFLLLVVGYPAADAIVPDIERKPLEEIATFC
jgi:iodotyrosine deiodinase